MVTMSSSSSPIGGDVESEKSGPGSSKTMSGGSGTSSSHGYPSAREW